MINNRQNGRRRGRGGNNGGGNNNQRQGGNQGRGDSANRIDSRARGNANQMYEKYKNLARDAQMSGDRVNIEYYLQFADHYFRVLADQRSRMENDNQPRRQQPFDINGDDDDDINEGEPIRAGEQNGEGNGDRDDRGDRQQNQRRTRDRGDRPERTGERPERTGLDRANGADRNYGADRNNGADRANAPDRNNRADGDDQPRGGYDGNDDEQQRQPRRRREQVAGQHRADPPAADESLDARAEQVIAADAPLEAPRRRGRPRREDAAPAAETAIAADRLPPSLGISAANDGDEEVKPRRRTRRPAAEAPSAAE